MAKEVNNKLEVYAENSTNVQNDATYQSDAERSNGSSSGVARSVIFNTMARQVSKAVVGLFNTVARKNPSETEIGTNKTVEELDGLIEKTIQHVAGSSKGNQIIELTHAPAPGGSGLSLVTINDYTFDDKNVLQVKFGGFSIVEDLETDATISINGNTRSVFDSDGSNVKYGDLVNTTRFIRRNGSSIVLLDNEKTKNFIDFTKLGLEDSDFTGTFADNIENIIDELINFNPQGNSILSTHISNGVGNFPNLVASFNTELKLSFTNYRLDISTVVNSLTKEPSNFLENKVLIITPDQDIYQGIFDQSVSPEVKMYLMQGKRNVYDTGISVPTTSNRPGIANVTFDEDIDNGRSIKLKLDVDGEKKWVEITPSDVGEEMNIFIGGNFVQSTFFRLYMFKFYRYTTTTAVVWEASTSSNGGAPTTSTLIDLDEVWLIK